MDDGFRETTLMIKSYLNYRLEIPLGADVSRDPASTNASDNRGIRCTVREMKE